MCIVVNVTFRISRIQDVGSFQLNPLVTTGRLKILRRIVTNQIGIRRYLQIELAGLTVQFILCVMSCPLPVLSALNFFCFLLRLSVSSMLTRLFSICSVCSVLSVLIPTPLSSEYSTNQINFFWQNYIFVFIIMK